MEKKGVIYFEDVCKLILRKFREDDETEFIKIMFKVQYSIVQYSSVQFSSVQYSSWYITPHLFSGLLIILLGRLGGYC